MAAVADSWEEMDDPRVVEERLKKLDISSSRKSPTSSEGPISVAVQDDSGRTPYRPDGPPQVRILKRTDPAPGTNGLIVQKRPESVSKPNKTYEEREAEYQEARLRIFGRTEDEPEPAKSKPTSNSSFHTSHSSPALMSTSSSSSSDRPVHHHPRPPQLTVVGPPLMPIPDPGPAFFIPPPLIAHPPRAFNHAYNFHNYRKPENVNTNASMVGPRNWYPPRDGAPHVSVMRTPKGPDGSHGFRSYR